ncbi:MAG: patatin-like phospholipase family protein [Patescibacteria group bacterium]|nr:patatin-like phospholipase family protein [Patescibacteria group bacterium]
MDAKKDLGKVCFIFSGGGAKGAVQAGQLQALVENGILASYFIAVSVGSLNGSKLAESIKTISKDDFANAVGILKNIWLNDIDSRKKIYNLSSKIGIALFKEPSLFDPAPLANLIHSLNGDAIVRSPIRLDVVVSRLGSAYEEVFSNTSSDPEILKEAVLASASIPGLFPLVEISGKKYFDGAMTAPLPVYLAAKAGYNTVFVLRTDAPPVASNSNPTPKVKNWREGLTLSSDSSRNKIEVMEFNWAENINKNLEVLDGLEEKVIGQVSADQKAAISKIFEEEKIKFRFYNKTRLNIISLYPKKLPASIRAFTFSKEDIAKAIEIGYKDALEQLNENGIV